MKKTRQNYLTITVIAALFLSGCAGLNKMRDKVHYRYIQSNS